MDKIAILIICIFQILSVSSQNPPIEESKNCLKRSFCISAKMGSERFQNLIKTYSGILEVCQKNPKNCQQRQYAVMEELLQSYNYGLNATKDMCETKYICGLSLPETFEVAVINKRVSA